MNGYNRNLHFSINWPGKSQRKCSACAALFFISVTPPLGDLVLYLDLCTQNEGNVYRSLWGATRPTLTSLALALKLAESLHSVGTPAVPLTLLSPSTACLPAFSWSGVSCLKRNGADWPQSRRKEFWPSAPLYPKWNNILYWSVLIPA